MKRVSVPWVLRVQMYSYPWVKYSLGFLSNRKWASLHWAFGHPRTITPKFAMKCWIGNLIEFGPTLYFQVDQGRELICSTGGDWGTNTLNIFLIRVTFHMNYKHMCHTLILTLNYRFNTFIMIVTSLHNITCISYK